MAVAQAPSTNKSSAIAGRDSKGREGSDGPASSATSMTAPEEQSYNFMSALDMKGDNVPLVASPDVAHVNAVKLIAEPTSEEECIASEENVLYEPSVRYTDVKPRKVGTDRFLPVNLGGGSPEGTTG